MAAPVIGSSELWDEDFDLGASFRFFYFTYLIK